MSVSLCVAAKGRCDPLGFLDALLADGFIIDASHDVHIAHDGDLPAVDALLSAGVRLHRRPKGTSILRLWGWTIAMSNHPTVAVLDVSCPPAAGWWDGVQRALRAGERIFSGPVVSGWRADQREIVGYLVDYAQFDPPLDPSVREVPGINFICDRSLLDPEATLVDRGLFKTFTLWRLERERHIVTARHDEVRVVYHRPLHPGAFLRRRYRHGRCFAARRFDSAGQPNRAACILGSPILPCLRCWRIWRVARRHASLRAAWWRQLHWIALSEIAWSWGEFIGYSIGAGNACDELD
ncbi:MAG: hypothetical protein ABI541_13290 [Betaproteobacteria bacterium]